MLYGLLQKVFYCKGEKMKEYLIDFAKYIGFPDEAIASLMEVWDKVQANEDAKASFDKWIARYNDNCMLRDWTEYDRMLDDMKRISGVIGVSHRQTDLLIFMCLSKHLRELYERDGYTEEMFRTSMLDLYVKMMEEHDLTGLWGTSVGGWFSGFFNMDRFGFGILQFELIEFGWPSYEDEKGHKLSSTSNIVNIHIPGIGRLTKEKCAEAYKLAADFYRDRFDMDEIPFMCASWLLDKPVNDTLPESSNIRQFMDTFDVFSYGKGNDRGDMWRVFGKEYTDELEKLPERTSVQRTYKKWLINGGSVSNGSGVFFLAKPGYGGPVWKLKKRMYSFYSDYDEEAEARGDYTNY